MLEVNRIGFTELAGTEGAGGHSPGGKRVKYRRSLMSEALVLTQGSVILVHGLRGHPYHTWASSRKADGGPAIGSSSWSQKIKSHLNPTTSPSESNSAPKDIGSRQQEVFWPRDYLAKDIHEARVWTYGYNADVIGGLFEANNQNSVSEHGRDLAVRLERDIENEAMRRSETCRQRTRLIVFLGTPHRGSPLASWGEIASSLAGAALHDSHKKIVETLKVDSEVLDNIHEQFVNIIFEHGIRIHSFQEGRGMSGIKGLHKKVGCQSLEHTIIDLTNLYGQVQVVSDPSSKLGLPRFEKIESVDANHMQMVKCQDRSNESYRCVAGVLKQLLKGASSNTKLPLASVIQMQQAATLSAKHRVEAPSSTASSYCIPFLRNRRFIGRTEKLKELEEKLIISGHCSKLALVGLGGVGKTQVALELAYTVKEHWPAYSIFWVPAVSAESFEQAYRDIATRCSIALDPKREDPKASIQQYLNSDAAGKWLLIVDNADDEEILFGESSDSRSVTDYLPQSETGLTLFTTRHREIAVSLARSEVVEVDGMDHKEAEAFLRKSLTRQEMLHDKKNTTELLNELTFLPLAIAQAAAYINAMQLSILEYLSLLRGTEQDAVGLLSREFHDDTRYKGSKNLKNAVAATWLISFDRVRQSDPFAADLLSFMSCIEHKAIPRTMLPSAEPVERMVHAIGTLRAYAFVTRRGEGDIYDMHRLVHLATKVWLDRHRDAEALNNKVAAHLAEIFPLDVHPNQALWREYLPHALQFLRITEKLDIEARYELCLMVGRCLMVDGRIREAVVWLSECFLWRRDRYPENHPNRLESQYMLAVAYRAVGQVKEAVELLEQVVAIEGKMLKEDHPNRLTSQHSLASVYQADGQVKKAIQLLERVVAIKETVFKEDHPDRLVSQHELAVVYRVDGQVREAVKLLEHVVLTQEKVFKEEHPRRLSSQHMLAVAYRKDGQAKKALELLEEVVAIREHVLTEDHPDRLASQHELARAYQANGRGEKAVKLLEHVVAIEKKVHDEDHPDRLISQRALLNLYAQQRSKGDDDTEASAQG
ncbi:MAG: hypothetical protein Q9190_005609 [Brigantiaea leucoxantha]